LASHSIDAERCTLFYSFPFFLFLTKIVDVCRMGCVKPARKVYGFILFYFLFFLFLTRGSDSAGWDVSGLPERCFILFYFIYFI